MPWFEWFAEATAASTAEDVPVEEVDDEVWLAVLALSWVEKVDVERVDSVVAEDEDEDEDGEDEGVALSGERIELRNDMPRASSDSSGVFACVAAALGAAVMLAKSCARHAVERQSMKRVERSMLMVYRFPLVEYGQRCSVRWR